MEHLDAEKILDLTIQDAFPHIFNKGTVYVAPDTPIRNIALFLIPLRELYTSGIVVMENNPYWQNQSNTYSKKSS